jgi:hypothetical protein
MKILPADEWDKLRPIFEREDWWLPEPYSAFALVEEDDAGEIIFVLMVQAQLVIEPMWVAPAHRSKVDWREAIGRVEEIVTAQELFPGVAVHSSNPATEYMARQFGMTEVPVRTYVRRFEPKAAAATEGGDG